MFKNELRIMTFILLGSSSIALAAPCFKLLKGSPVSVTREDRELGAARLWLETHSGGYAFPQSYNRNLEFQNFVLENGGTWSSSNYETQYDWTAKFALLRWSQWKKITPVQRRLALRLELSKLSPRAESNLIAPMSTEELAILSGQNRSRLMARVRELFPVRSQLEDPKITQMSQWLHFRYLRYREITAPTGIYEPLASPREMKDLDLNSSPVDTFYSNLVGDSTSVEFEATASASLSGPEPIYNFGGSEIRPAFVLEPEFAKAYGMTLPTFKSVYRLIAFFNFWDPDAITQLIRHNAFSLPSDVKSAKDLIRYMRTPDGLRLFNQGFEYSRLAPLRTKLSQYVMTPADTDAFLKEAFYHWLQSTSELNPDEYDLVEKEYRLMGGVQKVVRSRFLLALNMSDGLSLRLPLAVTKENLKLENVQGIFFNAPKLEAPKFSSPMMGRWSLIDHSTKP